MFSLFKKNPKSGQEEITGYIKTIEHAVFFKIYNDFKQQFSDDQEAKVLAMAFVAKLFALDSPDEGDYLSGKTNIFIGEILKNESDQDVLYGIILSLQSLYAIEHVNGSIDSRKAKKIQDAVILFKNNIDIPRKLQNFEIMKQLSLDLHRKYSKAT